VSVLRRPASLLRLREFPPIIGTILLVETLRRYTKGGGSDLRQAVSQC
jgi:hypothetical protein